MEIRFQNSPKETASMPTSELRKNFVCESLIQDDKINLVYSHYDRVIIGGAKPVDAVLELTNHPELRSSYFLERREIGIINIGGEGEVEADGIAYRLDKLDCVYIGKSITKVTFKSLASSQPALFYLLSGPAHRTYPNRLLKKEEASPSSLGELSTANQRTIYKYIHSGGIESCQLVMGLTILGEGSVWNTMPAHTHTRRMEAYFYFDIARDQRVFHFMGEPTETRHMLVADLEAIISPPWSIHAGCGTTNYSFIWGMAGENYDYTDMDPAPVTALL